MASGYIVCHGRESYRGEKFIAPCDLYFYAESGRVTKRGNGLAVLSTGGMLAVGCTQEVKKGQEATEIGLTSFNGDELAQHLAVATSSQLRGKLYILGTDIIEKAYNKHTKAIVGVKGIVEEDYKLSKLVQRIVEEEEGIESLHLINCRLGRRGGSTLPLGNESPHDSDQDKELDWDGSSKNYTFKENDTRHEPSLWNFHQTLGKRAFSALGADEFENLPSGTKAPLDGFGGRRNDLVTVHSKFFEAVENPIQWTTPKKAWQMIPRVIWDPDVPMPATLADSLPSQDWRDAFWYYLNGSIGRNIPNSGVAKANLHLWTIIGKWLSPDNVFHLRGDDGREYEADGVLDSEIFTFASGHSGYTPTVDQVLLEHAMQCSGNIGYLWTAIDKSAARNSADFLRQLTSLPEGYAQWIFSWVEAWAGNHPAAGDGDRMEADGEPLRPTILDDVLGRPDFDWAALDATLADCFNNASEQLVSAMEALRSSLSGDTQAAWDSFAETREELRRQWMEEQAGSNG
ncbi:hypothetical protein [Kitasatospora sp. MBT63]|uniref:hypothetical protein n=1 Tax=Kitasatospora sp. MBT63 TaxID=1444768 RepID=UPI0011EA6252|nr:hypothetical protein [Kitasatospora sp. MBT63]